MPPKLIYSLFLFTGLFVLLEGKSLLRRRAYKELLVIVLLITLAWSYGIDYVLSNEFLPNPNILITIFKPASESLENFFQLTN